eukprot:5348929-Pleurochrysis_carterae.AAC.1
MSTARAREPRVRTAATSGSRLRWRARVPPVRAAATDGTRRHAASARRQRVRACASSARCDLRRAPRPHVRRRAPPIRAAARGGAAPPHASTRRRRPCMPVRPWRARSGPSRRNPVCARAHAARAPGGPRRLLPLLPPTRPSRVLRLRVC